MEIYITGTGQRIKVHDKKDCQRRNCVIHNPSDHHMKDWPTHWRNDKGIMERICKCEIGHPDPDDVEYRKSLEKNKALWKYLDIHGCCGCCNKKEI